MGATLTSINAFYYGTTLEPAPGGSYREGIVGQPTFLNPLIAQSDVDKSINKLLYSDFLDLVERHDVNDEHTVWTFTMKQDLEWSDGKPITSNDVLFTVEAIQDPDTRSPLSPTWQGIAVERVSEYEIRFTLKSPYAFFLENMEELTIVPQHVFGTIPLANLRLSDYNLEPVSSGPYVFEHLTKKKDGFITSYVLRANDHSPQDETLISEFFLRFFPTYEEATVAFNRREIDALGGIDYQELSSLQITHNVSALQMPRYYALFLNQNATLPLKEKAVRQALGLAVDRPRIIETVLHGYATPLMGPLHPQLSGYDSTAYETASSSPETARATLQNAGWVPNSEGVREKKSGKETMLLEFSLIVPDIAFLKETAEIIKDNWAEIGVRLTLTVLSPAEITRDTIKTRNYQMILFGNILRTSPDLFSFWHSSERFSPGLNLALYDNRTVDTLLETIRKEFDEDERNKDLTRLQTIIYEEVPAIFLFSPHYLYAHPKDLGGFEPGLIVTPAHRFQGVAKWYLETARVFK